MDAAHSNDADAALTERGRQIDAERQTDRQTDEQTDGRTNSAHGVIALHGRPTRDDVVIRLRQLRDLQPRRNSSHHPDQFTAVLEEGATRLPSQRSGLHWTQNEFFECNWTSGMKI